jgi:hypothetical protein
MKMKTKALAVKPLNSLNLRSMLVTNTASREYVYPTKPVSTTEPLTFAEIMFELDDVPNAHDDLFEDLELPDQHYCSRLSTLLKPTTPIGAAVRDLFLPTQFILPSNYCQSPNQILITPPFAL